MAEAVERASEIVVPALVLVELANDPRTASARLRQLRECFPESKIVAVVARLSMAELAGAFEAGIDGYLMHDISAASLIQSLRLVGAGERVFPSRLADLLVRADVDLGRPLAPSPVMDRLSRREIEILSCLVGGLSNKHIANHLEITEATVKVHLKSLLRKIHAENRTQAAIWALRQGLSREPEA